VGAGATDVAVAVATGAVATVGWPAILIGAGITFAVAGAIALAADGCIKMLWGDQTQLSGSCLGTADLHSFPVIPSPLSNIFDSYGVGNDLWFSNSAYTNAVHVKTLQVACPNTSSAFCSGNTPTTGIDYTFTNTYSGPYPGPNGYWVLAAQRFISNSKDANNVTHSTYYLGYSFNPASGTLMPPTYVPTSQSVAQSLADLPQSYLNQPISDEQMAAAVNTVLKNANQKNPLAMPELLANPITASDISAWKTQHPQQIPTVGDLFSPAAAPGSNVVVIPNPYANESATTPAGTTTTEVKADIDWGTFNPPELEQTPTANSILDPLFNFFPNWKNYHLPNHSSECPKPTFTAFNHVYTFDQLCIYTEMIKPELQAIFMVCWSIIVLLIILSA